jgi:hypothetical protein
MTCPAAWIGLRAQERHLGRRPYVTERGLIPVAPPRRTRLRARFVALRMSEVAVDLSPVAVEPDLRGVSISMRIGERLALSVAIHMKSGSRDEGTGSSAGRVVTGAGPLALRAADTLVPSA